MLPPLRQPGTRYRTINAFTTLPRLTSCFSLRLFAELGLLPERRRRDLERHLDHLNRSAHLSEAIFTSGRHLGSGWAVLNGSPTSNVTAAWVTLGAKHAWQNDYVSGVIALEKSMQMVQEKSKLVVASSAARGLRKLYSTRQCPEILMDKNIFCYRYILLLMSHETI